MSHSSMLKARRQHQKTRKILDAQARQAKQAKQPAKQEQAKPSQVSVS